MPCQMNAQSPDASLTAPTLTSLVIHSASCTIPELSQNWNKHATTVYERSQAKAQRRYLSDASITFSINRFQFQLEVHARSISSPPAKAASMSIWIALDRNGTRCQRKKGALGKGLGKTTGWIHRTSLKKHGKDQRAKGYESHENDAMTEWH